MFEDKCLWSALYPISNHSHIRQLQFATHAFSQQVLQQAVQIKYMSMMKTHVCITQNVKIVPVNQSPHLAKDRFAWSILSYVILSALDVNLS